MDSFTSNQPEMSVVKRDGSRVPVSFDKILNRIKSTCEQTPKLCGVNCVKLSMKVIEQIYDGIRTTQLDELTSQECASQASSHPDYGTLASRIVVSNHQKNTDESFSKGVETLYNYKHPRDTNNDNVSSLVSKEFYDFVMENAAVLDEMIDHTRDYNIDYFGFKTLERAYLLRVKELNAAGESVTRIIERPQHMWLRVAVGIHMNAHPTVEDCITEIKNTYEMMSWKYFTHATPTLFNAGTRRSQMSSCYLISMESDSIKGMYNTISECADISKWAGGIGLHVHNIRGNGSFIRGTNGNSSGLVPLMRVLNATARHVNQGGKRNGSFAIYLEPWHSDIEDFLELRKNHGDEESRARDLFYAMWMSDLFMKRVKENGQWTLMCPDECPGLSDVYGEEFEELYTRYESEGRGKKTVPARKIWFKILDSQIETGTPYLLYKDAANRKSNQKNLGTIKSSNLCCEIMEYSSPDETAVCNLASIGLAKFVDISHTGESSVCYDKLHHITKQVTKNLNIIIDKNFYPTPKTERSNRRHRPIGIGVQGLADVFASMKISFDSAEARKVNKEIFETIYHAAMEASNEVAVERITSMQMLRELHSTGEWTFVDGKEYEYTTNDEETRKLLQRCRPIREEIEKLDDEYCGSYSSFKDSPLHQGEFQFDLWGVSPSDRYDWDTLRQSVMKYGVRNSLLVAPMPTASTSQILGNNECFEPFTSNLYVRNTIAGEFVVVNKHLMRELIDLGVWSMELKNSMVERNGSIQHIDSIPDEVKHRYRTVWEMPMRSIIDMAADRAPYICQSQSMNLWMESPSYEAMTAMHFYAWSKGLKTGIYYFRTKPRASAQKFTVEPAKLTNTSGGEAAGGSGSSGDGECEMCSG